MGDKIRRIVAYYIKLYNTRDPFKLADYLNIEVQEGNLGDLSGCYMYLKKHRCIFLNHNLDYAESKMVMAHELGHAIMHTRTNCCFMASKTLLLTSKVEIQANKFAAELLISDECIRDNAGYTINQLSRLSGVHEELVKLKLS